MKGGYIYKDPRQDSGQRNISYTRYPKKCFTQTYRDLYGDAMLVLIWMSTNISGGRKPTETSVTEFCNWFSAALMHRESKISVGSKVF